jgi:Transglycosylase SLT domain
MSRYGCQIVGKVTRRGISAIAVLASCAVAVSVGAGTAVSASVTGTSGIGVPFGSAAQQQSVMLGQAAGGGSAQTTAGSSMPRELFVPDVLAVIESGIPAADVAKIKKLNGVRTVLTVSGGAIKIAGSQVNVIGVSPEQFRAWTPPAAAGDQSLWKALAGGEFISGTDAQHRLRLSAGHSYPVSAATSLDLKFGGSAGLAIPGVDAVVSDATAARLGLVKNLAVLINAPADNLASLVMKVRALTGSQSKVVSLQPTSTSTAPGKLPVDTAVPTGRPTTYIALYQESAAQFCPGLSWTVLAAIGEVESGNGQNEGPSSAGALGPMQFLPSTWKTWGTDGFGDTGPPDIMNPFDAVPSAARLLCAAGAAQGGQSLYNAIFAYNHADWYVNEVLAIAKEYAAGS